jgi:hypothetical protein
VQAYWGELMVIHNVWIVEKSSGILLFDEKIGSIETEADLLSGFLSAIYQFAELEMETGLESMEMGEYNLVYYVSHDLLFVMAADKDDDLSDLQFKIRSIKDSFLEEFPEIEQEGKEFLQKWSKNREFFKKFKFPIRELVNSWIEVELTTSIAEKMDYAEVYQQIFSRIAKITLPLFRQTKIKKVLEKRLSETLSAHQSVLNIEELSHIYDSSSTFLDILSVNLFSNELTLTTLKTTLNDLCKTVLNVLREYLGDSIFGEEFRTHILPYIKQDYNRIRELELDRFFLNYVI